MTAKSKWRGHDISYNIDRWVYSDNLVPVEEMKERPCGNCNRAQTKEGHDDCLEELPGVMNACCGHGDTDLAYIQFLDGYSIHGQDAHMIQSIMSHYRKDKN